jgi:hypothetical protein
MNASTYTPLESEEAKILVAYLRMRGLKFTHIGNETGHDPYSQRRAIRMKQQGVSRGFPDYLVIAGERLYGIELKRQRGGTVSPEQREWITALNEAGVPTIVARGAQDAIKFIEQQVGAAHIEF